MLSEVVKKISIVGASTVGKTSITTRFVHRFFPDSFLSTVGVNIQHKPLDFNGKKCSLDVWDIQGENYFDELMLSYITGSDLYIIVADGTNTNSLDAAQSINEGIESHVPKLPFVMFINKSDQKKFWLLDESHSNYFNSRALCIFETSAKSGEGIDEAFAYVLDQTFG